MELLGFVHILTVELGIVILVRVYQLRLMCSVRVQHCSRL